MMMMLFLVKDPPSPPQPPLPTPHPLEKKSKLAVL